MNKTPTYEKEISVIIPTFNKYPQNLFTLYSLQYQSFDLSKVEVIMVDDGSTDETNTIVNTHQFPFQFTYIKCKTNVGRPAARNIGLKAAKGRIILFLDAEIMVRPNFFEIHHLYHEQHPNLVISGILFIKRVYTVLFPNFSEVQMKECTTLMKGNTKFTSIRSDFMNEPRICPLIGKGDIANQTYRHLSIKTEVEKFYLDTVIRNYGYNLKNYQIPWQLFGTGHVSVPKSALDEVGLFAEYPGYGWDDCEMGYRLFKNGATYMTDRRLISYHQEHPRLTSIVDESKQNYYRFQETYLDVDQMIISLTFLPVPFNLHKTNQILINYKAMCEANPAGFPLMQKYFHSMLRKIGFLVSENREISDLKPAPINSVESQQLRNEKQKLRQLKKYGQFIECFERLESL